MRRSSRTRRTSALIATSILALALTATAAGTAAADTPEPPTVSASASGRTINVTVSNPNLADPDTFDAKPTCFPIIIQYKLGDSPFTWVPEAVELTGPDTAIAELIAAGFAPPGLSASASVVVPEDGLYIVGGGCEGNDGRSTTIRPETVIVGSATATGPAVTASVTGRAITASVTNTTADSGCGVAVGEISADLANRFQSVPSDVTAPGETKTYTIDVPRDGQYAVAALCGGGSDPLEFTNPPVLLEIPGVGTLPNQICFGSVCLPQGLGF